MAIAKSARADHQNRLMVIARTAMAIAGGPGV
jgi:hypothetical protein